MLYSAEIYNTLVSLVRKDVRGLSFSPEDFNSLAPQVNQRLWRLNYKDFETSKLSMDETGSFKVKNYTINLDVNGIGALPANYYHLVGNPWYIHPTAGRRNVDLITSLEHGQREMDFLTKGTALYPNCEMAYGATSDDMSLYVTPTTCTPIYIDYLRKVNVPYLDYYVNDTTLVETYMAETAVAVTVPLGSTAPQVIKNGVILRAETAGAANVTSYTLNFEWHDHDLPQIINIFMGLIGVQLGDQPLIQLEELDEPKIEKA